MKIWLLLLKLNLLKCYEINAGDTSNCGMDTVQNQQTQNRVAIEPSPNAFT